jgi:hypothetical protein
MVQRGHNLSSGSIAKRPASPDRFASRARAASPTESSIRALARQLGIALACSRGVSHAVDTDRTRPELCRLVVARVLAAEVDSVGRSPTHRLAP